MRIRIKIRILILLNKTKIKKNVSIWFQRIYINFDILIDFTDYLLTNKHDYSAAFFIIIKKAFYSLDHFILLEQLYLYGFRSVGGDFSRSS